MSWRDPKWVYQPAATHGDSQAFAQRQRERAAAVSVIDNEWSAANRIATWLAYRNGMDGSLNVAGQVWGSFDPNAGRQ